MEPTTRSDRPTVLPGRGPREATDLELGWITGVFGFRGEVRLHLHNPTSALLRDPRPVVLVAPDGTRLAATLSVRPGAGNRIIGRVMGVSDEAGAQALKDHRVWIPKAGLPALEADEFYVWQLEGCEVRIGDEVVGTVRGVQTAGPADVLEILGQDGEERFVPVLKEFVVRVDAAARLVELAPGALDEG